METPVYFLRALFAVITVCILAPTTAAQNPFERARDRTEESGADSRQSTSLRTTDKPRQLFLQNEDGDFVPIPDISYLQLIDLLEQQRQRSAPDFTISSLELTGQAEAGHARLAAHAVITIQRDGLVRVPLRLDGFILTETAKFQGEGEHFISQLGEERSSYTVWIRAAAGSRHEIQLDGLVSIDSDGIENRVRLPVVRAVNSRLEFTLPMKNPDVEVTAPASIVGEETVSDHFRRLTVVGMDEEFELYWKPDALDDPPIIPLEVRGQIRVSVQQPDDIRFYAQLRIRSFEKPLRAIHIRLPPGNEIIAHSVHDIGYDLRITETQSDMLSIVTFDLARATDQPVDLDLTTRLARPAKDKDGYVQVAGFQVLYALRQSGTIIIENSNQWNLDWKSGPHLARTSDLPAVDPSLSIDAAFEYYQQPYSLRVAAQSRRVNVLIDPTYLVNVSPDEIALSARLRCVIQSGSAAFLRVRLPGWKVQSIACDDGDRIEKGQPYSDETDPFVIRLANPSPGEFTIDVKATASASAEGPIDFQLPRAEATRVAPASVVISSRSKMNLVPRDGQLVNLIPDPSIVGAISADFQRPDALYYRTRNGEAIFAADVVMQQMPYVETHGRMIIDSDGADVTQTVLFDMPNDVVTLDAPPGVLNGSWELSAHDGSPLLSTTSGADGGHSLLSVQLPERTADRFTLVANYQISFAKPTIQDRTQVTVPFLIPLDKHNLPARISSTNFEIESADLDVELSPNSSWFEAPSDSHATSLVVRSDTLATSIDLTLSPTVVGEATPLLVDMTLLRTWLLPNGRYERAVFQLNTDLGSVRIRLPRNVDLGAIDVALNGDSVPVQMQGDELIIEFRSKGQTRHVIVISYPVTTRRTVGRIDLVFPRIAQTRWTRRFVWQLLLPSREHLLVGPSEMTSEDQWLWNGLLFSRRPVHDLSKFDQRFGVIEGPIESPNLHRYTYSILGGVEEVHIRTASRAQIVLFCSGIVLVVGLLSAYVSIIQNRIVLAVLLAALMAASFVVPAPTLLLCQGATLGIVLLLLAKVLRWIVTRRHTEDVLIRGKAFPGPATRSTVLVARQADLHSGHGTSRGSSGILISPEK